MKPLSKEQVLQEWTALEGGWSPLEGLAIASKTPFIVDGVIPASSIVWMVGPPQCGKTFVAMSIATYVAVGMSWQNHNCEQYMVIYIAAEGGYDIHTRRYAAGVAAGAAGPLLVVQARPQIGTPEGQAEVMAIVQSATNDGITFPTIDEFDPYNFGKWLTSQELETFERLCELEELDVELANHQLATKEGLRENLACDSRQLSIETKKRKAQRIRTELGRKHPMHRGDAEKWASQRCKPRYSTTEKSIAKHLGEHYYGDDFRKHKKVLVIIDTYSQTSPDDEKSRVSPYIKNLREIIDLAKDNISFVVLDHSTKSGDTFMGAQAKLGDSDVMIEVSRHDQLVTLSPVKMKTAKPFDPIHLKLMNYSLDGQVDAYGRTMKTLVIASGEIEHRMRKAVGTNEQTAASTVYSLVGARGPCDKEVLRNHFINHVSNLDKKPESVKRAFSRALESLLDDELLKRDGANIALAVKQL